MKCILTLILLGSGLAKASEGDADTREQCRAAVSGAYLGYMNDLDLLKSHLKASSESAFSLKARKQLVIKEAQALERRNETAKIPAAELDEELVGLRDSIEHTADAIMEADSRMVSIKDQIAIKETAFKKFHESLKPVFVVAHAKIVNQGAYPIKLQYRQDCAKFLQLCPLPQDQADALLTLSKTLEDGLACGRYAQIGRIR